MTLILRYVLITLNQQISQTGRKTEMKMFLTKSKWFLRLLCIKFVDLFRFHLKYFLLENTTLVFSAIVAAAGVLGFFAEIRWLVFLCAPVSLAARLFHNLRKDFDDFAWVFDSLTSALAVSVIGMFAMHFWIDQKYLISLFFSMNASVLLLYALKICGNILMGLYRLLRRKSYYK